MKLIENDALGGGILIVLFLMVIGAAEYWSRSRHPNPEYPRKFIHIVGGLGCLLFPFLITSPLMVAIIATIFALTFVVGQKTRYLQSLCSVKRKSRGSEYFPVAVVLLFFICQDHLWLYLSSLLILSIADAAAALVGCRFGSHCYRVGPNDSKSLEGSLAFLLLTFLVIFGLLLSLTDLGWANCVGAAFLTAVLLTGIEAVSIRGTDNIFIPVLTCFILLKITTKPLEEILFQCISMVLIFLVLQAVIMRFKIFTIRDSIIFQLFAYAAWSLGSVDWALPIFLTFACYCICRGLADSGEYHEITTGSLLQILSVPLCLLVAANGSGLYLQLYGPFFIAVIITFTCSTLLFLQIRLQSGRYRAGKVCTSLAMASPLVFFFLIRLFHSHSMPLITAAFLFGISLAITWLYLLYLKPASPEQNLYPTTILLCSGSGAALYLTIQSILPLPLWQPAY